MSRLVRLLLICIIAAAIPLKGLAAVMMIGCGPGHQRQVAASTPAHHGESASTKASHVDAAESQATAGSLDASELVDSADDTSRAASEASSASALKMKCSSCSPCCAAAAPAPDQQTSSPDLQASRFSFNDTGYVGVVTDVPHRPPRTFLA
jgi:hypothetical protein